jgi:hypothetical protein
MPVGVTVEGEFAQNAANFLFNRGWWGKQRRWIQIAL